jgi:hypothetical protein
MQHEEYEPHNQENVNERSRYMKCEKTQQPKNNQNRSDYPKHFVISLPSGANNAQMAE